MKVILLAALLLYPGGPVLGQPASGEALVRPLRGFRAEAATLLLQGLEGGALTAVFRLGPLVEQQSGVTIPIRVEIARSALGEGTEERAIEIFTYLVKGSDEVLVYLADEILIPPLTMSSVDGISYRASLEVPTEQAAEQTVDPAQLSLRVLVRRPSDGRFVLARKNIVGKEVAVDARAETGDDARGLGILYGPPPDRLPEVRGQGGDWSWFPGPAAILPVLSRGSSELLFRRLGKKNGYQDGAVTSIELRFERLRDAGQPPLDDGVSVQARAIPAGVDVLRLDFELPELSTGAFRVVAAVSGEVVSIPLELWIVDEAMSAELASSLGKEPVAGALSWPVVLEQQARLFEEASELGVDQVSQVAPVRRLRDGYREAIRDLGRDWSLEEALIRIAAVEDAVSLPPPLVAKTELKVAVEVGKQGAGATVALMTLHEKGYRSARNDQLFAAAARHRRLVLELSELLLTSDDESARASGADILARLSREVDSHGLHLEAAALLESAITVDPTNEISHYLMIQNREREGHYASALVHAERLLEVNAQHQRGRLRHAVLLRKMGRSRESEAQLRQLIDGGAAGAIGVVAHQELAKLLIQKGKPHDAAELLHRGLARGEGAEELRLLLAACYDLAGQPSRGAAVMAEWVARPISARPSARLLYASPPESELRQLEARVDRSARLYVPLLSGLNE